MQILGPTKTFQKPIYNIFEINKIDCDDDQLKSTNSSEFNFSYE
jgi:hypothetical protein